MANETYLSSLFSEITTPTTLDSQKKASAGVAGGRLRKTMAYCLPGAALATTDVVRFASFKTGDRIHKILISCTDAGTTGDVDCGVYLAGHDHDGAVVDVDLFASALDINAAALSQVDIFDEAALDDFDRGKTLWELNGDSVDPFQVWDITLKPTEATTNASAEFLLEIEYTAGD